MRPMLSKTMLDICAVLARRATCAKLKVGCVVTDKYGRIIGTGYNGVARGAIHCIDCPCKGSSAPKGSDLCEAIHAEQNSLLACREPDRIDTVYCTHAPCMRCTKLLLNTGCTKIFFTDTEDLELPAKQLWEISGRQFIHYKEDHA